MRFITSLLTISIFLLVLLGVGFYFTREYFLYRGTENFKKQVLILRRANAAQLCQSKSVDLLGVGGDGSEPTKQIRFLSDTEYILEVICPSYSFDPITVSENELDRFVQKVPGSAGLLLNRNRTGVELIAFSSLEEQMKEWFGRDIPFVSKTRPVVLEDNDFIVLQPGETLGASPLGSCEGYGYQCCEIESEIGQGEQINGLQGCEINCYTSCRKRPLVLSFTSNPFFDVSDRSVQIRSGESVDFGYLLDPGAIDDVTITLDYGDGESETLTETNGQVAHTYTCLADACQYQARLSVVDAEGVESADTSVTKILIRVSGSE